MPSAITPFDPNVFDLDIFDAFVNGEWVIYTDDVETWETAPTGAGDWQPIADPESGWTPAPAGSASWGGVSAPIGDWA